MILEISTTCCALFPCRNRSVLHIFNFPACSLCCGFVTDFSTFNAAGVKSAAKSACSTWGLYFRFAVAARFLPHVDPALDTLSIQQLTHSSELQNPCAPSRNSIQMYGTDFLLHICLQQICCPIGYMDMGHWNRRFSRNIYIFLYGPWWGMGTTIKITLYYSTSLCLGFWTMIYLSNTYRAEAKNWTSEHSLHFSFVTDSPKAEM